MYIPPRNDPEYSLRRLDSIMSRRRLSFNPYAVSDRELLELAASAGWGNEYDIVQMVILSFTRLHAVEDARRFDGIFFRIGNSREEYLMYNGALILPITSNETLRPVRSTYGSTVLRQPEDVARLVGKRVFVSSMLRGVDIRGRSKAAYRMHPLKGPISSQASTIREAMIAAKIEMLQRLLAYPESPDYLRCRKGLIEYENRVRHAIDIIRRYPDIPIPN